MDTTYTSRFYLRQQRYLEHKKAKYVETESLLRKNSEYLGCPDFICLSYLYISIFFFLINDYILYTIDYNMYTRLIQ